MNPRKAGLAPVVTGPGQGTARVRAVFSRLAGRITGVSLFLKVMGIALLLIAFFGAESIIETRALMGGSLKKAAKERNALVARQVESSLTDRLITGDLVEVYRLLKGAEEVYPDIKYVFILDPQKRVLVSTLDFPLSGVMIWANWPAADGSVGTQLFETEAGLIEDLAVPIMGGRLGTIRIGFSQEHIKRAISEVTAKLAISVAFVALIGVGFSYLLAFILTRPINDLINGIERLEEGDSDVRVRPWFKDEIGRLTDAFNNMSGALARKKALKQELVRKLITSQEEERQRIARELHDKTSQSLTSIKIGLKLLEKQSLPPEALAQLDKFRELLSGSLDELHELAVDLRPPALGDLGLPGAIKELADNFKRAFGIEVECAISDHFAGHRLGAEIEIGLYRIVQEIFSNIEKHSGADLVRVSFRREAGGVLLAVRDNGRGFDADRAQSAPGRKPLGLFGMRERAEILGGKLDVSSSEGHGTEITVSLPVKA